MNSALTAVDAPLLERSDALARIESALASASAAQGRFVVVEGPAGIGKTALLNAARALATERGLRLLRSRGAELERDFAFGVVRQLFEAPLADASAAELAELLQGPAGTAAGLLGLPGSTPGDAGGAEGVDPSFAVLHGLYWLSANLAAQGPVCLVVDDAHWADTPSLRYLAFLITRLEELDMALVVATRPREAGTNIDLLTTITTDDSAEAIRLAPLTRAAVRQLVESGLHATPDPAFVDACLHSTGGTPFLIRALVGSLADGAVVPSAESARRVERIGARTVAGWIRLRLRSLPESAGRLARAVSVLERGELLDAATLAGLDPDEAAAAADLLVAAGILEHDRPLAFVHPIVRAGIYTELTSAERAQAHRSAARLLALQPGSTERVAEHLLISEPAADGWTVEHLVEAAHTARRSGAPESAAVYLRRALAEPPSPDARPGLLLELGVAEASAGLDDWRTSLEAAVRAAPDEAARASASMTLALALSRAQRFAESVDVLDRAAAGLGAEQPRLQLLLEIAAVGSGMNGAVTAPTVAARRRALRALAAADLPTPPELIALAAFIAVLRNEPAEIGADLATRALRSGEIEAGNLSDRPWFSFATWFSQTTVSLVWAEKYAQVRPLLDDSIAEARATGDSSRLSVGLAHRGWASLRRGDLSSAESDARIALAAAELPAPPMYRILNAGILVEALVEQGQLDEAERVLEPMNADAEVGSLPGAVLRHARGRLRGAQGRHADALEDQLAVGAFAARAQAACPSYLPWRSEAALAHLALGDIESARRLADEELALARTFGAPRTLGVALRAAGLAGGSGAGETLLREAVAVLETADARIEHARALTDLGALLRRCNRRTEARAYLRTGLDVAHRASASPLAERAETELRATGARPRRAVLVGLDSLTASERRVAELASQNMTNREIAQLLFVTARTVEGHLTSVFRKLQLDSRDELAAALAAPA